jgi:hypothetical protein
MLAGIGAIVWRLEHDQPAWPEQMAEDLRFVPSIVVRAGEIQYYFKLLSGSIAVSRFKHDHSLHVQRGNFSAGLANLAIDFDGTGEALARASKRRDGDSQCQDSSGTPLVLRSRPAARILAGHVPTRRALDGYCPDCNREFPVVTDDSRLISARSNGAEEVC